MAMKIVSWANRKGGVGKSTEVQIFAPFCAAILGLKTVVIDLDEQGNVSNRHLKMENKLGDWIPPIHPETEEIREEDPDFDGRSSAVDLFYNREVYPYPTSIEGLEIIPSHGLEVTKLNKIESNQRIQSLLYHFFKLPEVQEMEWDIALIDTPPSMNALTLSAIRASTNVVIPAIMEKKSVEGLVGVIAKINGENREKPVEDATRITGILPSLFMKNQTVHKKYFDMVDNDPRLTNYLIRNVVYDRSDLRKLDELDQKETLSPLSPFDPKSCSKNVKNECMAWCLDLAERMDLVPQSKIQELREIHGLTESSEFRQTATA